MREIKFRAWDKEDERFIYFGVFDLDADYHICEDKFIRGEVMQYTGLKDRHGVEIYEGDIIKETFPEGSIVSEVIFRNGAFGFKDGETGFNSFDETIGLITPQTNIDGEVIGNIYESPELLKEEE